jgi:hypothetical protein
MKTCHLATLQWRRRKTWLNLRALFYIQIHRNVLGNPSVCLPRFLGFVGTGYWTVGHWFNFYKSRSRQRHFDLHICISSTRQCFVFFWGGAVSDPLCRSSSSALHFF